MGVRVAKVTHLLWMLLSDNGPLSRELAIELISDGCVDIDAFRTELETGSDKRALVMFNAAVSAAARTGSSSYGKSVENRLMGLRPGVRRLPS